VGGIVIKLTHYINRLTNHYCVATYLYTWIP